jgi:arsenite-transporting ATPase
VTATATPLPARSRLDAHNLRPLDWLDWRTPCLFFTGKGGVGKTTVASTVSVSLANAGNRVLLVSTDPASNLDDVFGFEVSGEPTQVPEVSNLFVLNIDPEAAAATYRERIVAPYRGVLPDAAIRSIEEQLSGARTVEIAAFNEFTHLIANRSRVAEYDYILFDTAPTGHTLRLLTLPSAWTGFIETNVHGASCLGPLAGLDAQRRQYQETVQALADGAQTTLVLVSKPEASALHEAARASGELAELGVVNQRLVLNGVFTNTSPADPVATALADQQQNSLGAFPEALQTIDVHAVPLVSAQLTGVPALRELAHPSQRVNADSPQGVARADQKSDGVPGLEGLVDALDRDGRGVIMTMGKGGVGKTTIAAALATALSRHGHHVHLSTTDPAAHLEQVLDGEGLAGLTVSRIDAALETSRYTQEVIAAAGPLDEEARALLEEHLRSPCTEEIAAFRAFAPAAHHENPSIHPSALLIGWMDGQSWSPFSLGRKQLSCQATGGRGICAGGENQCAALHLSSDGWKLWLAGSCAECAERGRIRRPEHPVIGPSIL